MKTFVINVSTNEKRRKHIVEQINKHSCIAQYTFVHRGDMSDLTDEIMQKYFAGELNFVSPQASCTYKHLLVYWEMIEQNIDLALVLEDDVFLYRNFCYFLSKIIEEIRNKKISNLLISLDDSTNEFVKSSQMQKNVFLYPNIKTRLTGAYIVDRIAAQNMINEVVANKCHYPIDWFQNICSQKKLINIYWAQPALVMQGSLNGRISSLIDNKKTGWWRIWSFKITRFYKKLLYKLR